jgi:hypothetical protein
MEEHDRTGAHIMTAWTFLRLVIFPDRFSLLGRDLNERSLLACMHVRSMSDAPLITVHGGWAHRLG